jgi:hypothetical protein
MMVLMSCYSKSVCTEATTGNKTQIRTRYSNSKRIKIEKYEIYSPSGKLLEKGKVSILQGTWPEVLADYRVTYDTISGRWVELYRSRSEKKRSNTP